MSAKFVTVAMAAALTGAIALGQGSAIDREGQPIGPQHSTFKHDEFNQSSNRQSQWIDDNAAPASSEQGAPGDDRPDSRANEAIRQHIAELTNAAVSIDGLQRAATMLTPSDRERLESGLQHTRQTSYQEVVQAFRTQWKARYGEDFDLARQKSAVADYYVLRGQRTEEEAIIASQELPGQNGQQQPQTRATIVVPPNSQLKKPALILQLNNDSDDATDWRLDAPDAIRADTLCRNLEDRLRKMVDGQIAWPTDQRDAYRIVAYQVLASFSNQPPERSHDPAKPQPKDPENPSIES